MRKRLFLIALLSGLLGASGRLLAQPAKVLPPCPNIGCWPCYVNGNLEACCVYADNSSCGLSDPYNCTGHTCP